MTDDLVGTRRLVHHSSFFHTPLWADIYLSRHSRQAYSITHVTHHKWDVDRTIPNNFRHSFWGWSSDLEASYFYIGEPMGSDLLGKQWAYIPADTEMRMLISSTQNHPFRQIRLSTKHMREHQQHGMAFEDRTRSSIRSTTSFFLRFAVLTNKRECISHELWLAQSHDSHCREH